MRPVASFSISDIDYYYHHLEPVFLFPTCHMFFFLLLLQCWGDDLRSHLQSSRSADRLHVPHPRDISRKMSTNSEYAVITYA